MTSDVRLARAGSPGDDLASGSTELMALDATAQAELVRSREVTPVELVEAALRRIEDLNPDLNAVIHRRDDAAMAAAMNVDPDDAAPFAGVPLLIKDAVCHTAGDPFHAGSRFLRDRDWTATADSHLARRFRQAGFVIAGRTNTPEMAGSTTTEPLAYGATHNPWDVGLSAGGSSGGSAAAVASGMVAAAHGNDMGGSIRIPAAFCGLVGLKPSRARTSLGPAFGEYWGLLTHEHVLTRSVRDTAAILDVTAGAEPGDPYSAPPQAGSWTSHVGANPGRLRIGLRAVAPAGVCDVDPVCAAAAAAVGRLLESLGHDVAESSPTALDTHAELKERGSAALCAYVAREVDRWKEWTGEDVPLNELEPAMAARVEQGRAMPAPALIASRDGQETYTRAVSQWWADGWDLLLTPTTAITQPALGYMAPLAPQEDIVAGITGCSAFASPFNVTGQPAISLPLGMTPDGLPVGVQLVAAYGREDLLIRIASQLEAAQPWRKLSPIAV